MTIKPVQNPSLVIDTNSGLAVQNNVYIAAIAGYVFQEYELAAYAVVLKSMNGADSFYLGPTAYTTNITLGAARQAFISFGCYATGTWDFLGQNGAATGN